MAGEVLLPSSYFLLDTGIVIRHLRNDKRAHDLLDLLEQVGEISTSAITYMEILVKCRPHEELSTRLFFDRVPPLVINREVSEKAALLIIKYQSVFNKDNPRQFPDALIAATAWQQGVPLVTLNKKHFGKTKIKELTVKIIDQETEDWVSQLSL